jgi:hypothetical protein
MVFHQKASFLSALPREKTVPDATLVKNLARGAAQSLLAAENKVSPLRETIETSPKKNEAPLELNVCSSSIAIAPGLP